MTADYKKPVFKHTGSFQLWVTTYWSSF